MVHSRKNYIAIIFDNKKMKESRDRKKRRYFMKERECKNTETNKKWSFKIGLNHDHGGLKKLKQYWNFCIANSCKKEEV